MANPASYLPNIPASSDLLSVSQGQIQNNFSALQTWIEQNHVDSASGAPQSGKHTFVQLPVQAGTPTGGFLAGEDSIYSATSAVTGLPELVFVRGDGVAIGSIPQTYEITTYGTGTYTFNAGGQGNITYDYAWTRFPSGLLQLWATQTTNGPAFTATGLVIQFPTGGGQNFPGFTTAVYNVQLTLQWTDNTGANSNQPIVLVKGQTTTSQFRFTRESQNQYVNKGSIVFTALGI